MSSYFIYNVPDYWMRNFRAVRSAADNLHNVINVAEIVNTCQDRISPDFQDKFDVAIFSSPYRRALINKEGGHFSMGIPFQIINEGNHLSFNMDFTKEPVSGQLLAILKSAASTWRENPSAEDITLSISDSFGLDVLEASRYCDAFLSTLSEDHGYFRFDDDPKNANGRIHPRYHYDFFFLNSTSIKFGADTVENIECFYSMCDPSIAKRFLRA